MSHGGRRGLHAVDGLPAMNTRVRRTGWRNMVGPEGLENDAQQKRDGASVTVEGGWWG